jgi:ribosomal protein S27E
MVTPNPATTVVNCPVCGAQFKTPQGLAGHKRFRYGDARADADATRAQSARLELLEEFEENPNVPPNTTVLMARLNRRYGDRRGIRSDTDCVVCGAVCKTSQGLAGHMRHRHGAGTTAPGNDARLAAELVRYIAVTELPEPIEEALWEKILRLSGFRW